MHTKYNGMRIQLCLMMLMADVWHTAGNPAWTKAKTTNHRYPAVSYISKRLSTIVRTTNIPGSRGAFGIVYWVHVRCHIGREYLRFHKINCAFRVFISIARVCVCFCVLISPMTYLPVVCSIDSGSVLLPWKHDDVIAWKLFQHPTLWGFRSCEPEQHMELNKRSRCRWFETPWRSCDVCEKIS